jgi:hypothetical protein
MTRSFHARFQLLIALGLLGAGCAAPVDDGSAELPPGAENPEMPEPGEPGTEPGEPGEPGEPTPPPVIDPEARCTCDVTSVCDEGCTCDVACSATIGDAPIGEFFEMVGRAETIWLWSSEADRPIDRVAVYDDAYRPTDASGRPFAPPRELGQIGADSAWTGAWIRPATAAADVDDDGIEDALVLDSQGLSVLSLGESGLHRWQAYPSPVSGRARLAAGDVDGDGVAEAVFGILEGSELNLRVLDLDGPVPRVSADHFIDGVLDAAMTTADIDGDRKLEIVVAKFGEAGFGQASLSLVALGFDADGVLVEKASGTVSGSNCPSTLVGSTRVYQIGVDVTGYDFDRDHDDELALVERCGNEIRTMKLALTGAGLTGTAPSIQRLEYAPITFDQLRLSDDRPQIAVTENIVRREPEVFIAYTRTSSNVPAVEMRRLVVRSGNLLDDGRVYLNAGQSMAPSMSVGDVNLDGRTDVLVTYTEVSAGGLCFPGRPCDLNITPTGVRLVALDGSFSPRLIAEHSLPNTRVDGRDGFAGLPVVVAADLDGDSVRVRATGEVLRRTSTPHVNAVLAAPPTWLGQNGVAQNGVTGTTFGLASSESTGSSTGWGASASATFSYEASFLEVAEVRASLELSYEYERDRTRESTTTVGSATSTGAEDDAVVYRVTPFASHVYEVVAHSDPSQIGRFITIDVPNPPVEVSQSLARFREFYGTLADELVPPGLLTHEIGDPHSYKRPNDCTPAALAAAVAGRGTADAPFRSPDLVDVGNTESGSNHRFVSVAEQTTLSETHTLGVTLGLGGSVAGYGLDVTAGLSHSWSNFTTLGHETVYSGDVSHIAGELDVADRYSWGLCVYDYVADNGQAAFPVIDYVVTRPDGT